MLKTTPAILMALYDIDLLEEAAIIEWHRKTPEHDGDVSAKVREAAAPFMAWLWDQRVQALDKLLTSKFAPPDNLFGFMFDEILDERAVNQIKACAPALRELFSASTDQPRTQRAILEGVTRLVTAAKHGDGMLKRTPAILMALYDIDLLEEAAIIEWHGKARGQNDDVGAKVREAAAPFMEWLREAEEESSAESVGEDNLG